MKPKSILVGGALCAAFSFVGGCEKKEAAPAPVPPVATEASPSPTAKAVEAVPPAPTQAITEAAAQAAAQATNQVNSAEQQAQGLIDRAKAYVADQKYQDALSSLSQLAGTKLTSEQQNLVAELKAQIQSALAKAATKDPASALGGVLGGKK